MNIYPYKGVFPRIDPSVWIAPTATIIGDVTIGAASSIWFGAVIRGDVMPIRIGNRVSVQDNAVLHATLEWCETLVGDDVTIGHNVILHGCSVESRVIVGMGTIVLDHAIIGADTIVGAGSLITLRARIASGVLALGRPAKEVRPLTDSERQSIRDSAERYTLYSRHYSHDHVGQLGFTNTDG